MLEIREMSYDDLSFFWEVRNSCAHEFLHNPKLFSLEEVQEWYNSSSPKYFIIYNENENLGYFRTSNHDKISKSMYIGCDLHEKFRNKGLGFIAYKLFLSRLFNNSDLDKVQLEVLSTNNVAKKLYSKLGFQKKPEFDKIIHRENKTVVSEFWELEKLNFLP